MGGVENSLSNFVFLRTYAQVKSNKFYETRLDSVIRLVRFLTSKIGNGIIPWRAWRGLLVNIYRGNISSSMRMLQFAGPEVDKCNSCIYNCAFISIDSLRSIMELSYLLMRGCGVGYSIENKHIVQLPKLAKRKYKEAYIELEISVLNLNKSLFKFLSCVWKGYDTRVNIIYNPDGLDSYFTGLKREVVLKSLEDMFNWMAQHIESFRKQRVMSPLGVLDLINFVGFSLSKLGNRRCALASISDPEDKEVRDCKKGQFYLNHPQRSYSNNSAIYYSKPSWKHFHEEFEFLKNSGTGERGMVNMRGSLDRMPTLRKDRMIEDGQLCVEKGELVSLVGMGYNPCFEVLLQSRQFCNLSEINVKPNSSKQDIIKGIKYASMIGTLQGSLCDFHHILSREWRVNSERHRLMGVSLTGILNQVDTFDETFLRQLKRRVRFWNFKFSQALNINPSSATTCIKPSGTNSLVNGVWCPGMHPAYSRYFIRRVRASFHDSVSQFMIKQGFLSVPEIGTNWNNVSIVIFSFPVAVPSGVVIQEDFNCMQQMELYKRILNSYVELGISITVYVRKNEWGVLKEFVWKNWHLFRGSISFYPVDDASYQLAPYEKIDRCEYEKWLKYTPKNVNFKGVRNTYNNLDAKWDSVSCGGSSDCS